MTNMTPFDSTRDGRTVDCITLTNGAYSARILTLGCILQSLIVPDRNGNPTDIVLGFDSPQAYEAQSCYIGTVIGRCANRTAGGRITLGGRSYALDCNDAGVNHLHGGYDGFDRRIWSAALGENSVTLSLDSPDGDQGYPAALHVEVTYTLLGGTLTIEYRADASALTLCNLTNHSYFNLAGHDSGDVGAQKLTIFADHYTPINENSVPTGEISSVAGTALDFRLACALSARWDSACPQIQLAAGYDHSYLFGPAGPLRQMAYAACDSTGIELTMRSTMPAMQLYSGNFLSDALPTGKSGAHYGRRHGFCLETQYCPNALAIEQVESPLFSPENSYRHQTAFHFSVG